MQLPKKSRCPSIAANVPEDVFHEICSYLSLTEIWRLGSVCSRWYDMTRSETLWKRVDVASLNLSEKKSLQLISNLPPSVKELRIGNCAPEFMKLGVPRLYHILLERFPDLHTLIIQNVILENPFVPFHAINGFVLNCSLPMDEQIRKYYSVVINPPDVDADFNTLVSLLSHVTVLSLRNTCIAVDYRSSDLKKRFSRPLLSKIKVLDLTNSLSVIDQTITQLVQLPFLEELYLAGTAIQINGVAIILSEVPNLKILDLENTVVASETFSLLRDRGQNLVEIYLGHTALKDSDLIDVDEGIFPVLEKICLQDTIVSEIGVKKLLLSVPSLTHIFLTNSYVEITWIIDQPSNIKEKLKYDDIDGSEDCDHFLKNKFDGKFD